MAITAAAIQLAQPRDSVIWSATARDGDALARLIEEPMLALGGITRDGDGIALVELSNPGIDTLVAEGREGLQGFLQLRWGLRSPSNEWMRGSAELRRHYVRTRHRGAGVAVRLLQQAVRVACARGASGIWLKIDKDAGHAVRFYQKHEFRIAGSALFMDGQRQREHWVMHRSLVKR